MELTVNSLTQILYHLRLINHILLMLIHLTVISVYALQNALIQKNLI